MEIVTAVDQSDLADRQVDEMNETNSFDFQDETESRESPPPPYEVPPILLIYYKQMLSSYLLFVIVTFMVSSLFVIDNLFLARSILFFLGILSEQFYVTSLTKQKF
jgi:hypothetical protein